MDEPEQTRILIAEGNAKIRLALREYLQAQPGLDVVGEAADVRGLLEQTEASCPDLVLFAWELPSRPKTDLLTALRNQACRPQVVVLGKRPESSLPAMDAGADAYVFMGDGPGQVASTIRWLALEARYA